MEETPNLKLPYIMPSQAQKHVTHNEALRMLDAVVQLSVLDRDRTEPPAEPSEGDRHIVAAPATGAWTGHENEIADWRDATWQFLAPRPGWIAWCIGDDALLCWTDSAWSVFVDVTITFQNLALLGLGATADTENPFTAKLNKALWTARYGAEGGDGDLRYTMNKESGGDTLSVLMQTDWSGRAEMGLVGDDDFVVKVSSDGSDWKEAIRIDNATGTASFPRTGALASMVGNLFEKADAGSVAFTRTGAGTLSLKAGTIVELAGFLHVFSSATAVMMPALSAGTDYAVYVCNDGTVRADANFSAPSGFNTSTSRQIGGFHYAPGGNATGTSGGNTTPGINEHSLWDLKWRPACPDPRGMTLVAAGFWCDIYLLGVDHHIDGTSRNNVTIADGASPPKVPPAFGGNGSASYSSLTWWEAHEVMLSHGKRLLSIAEFAAAAYGARENQARGSDPVTTGLSTTNSGSSNSDQQQTSRWGVIQATGCLWVWGDQFGGPHAGASWANTNGGRGQVYQQANAVVLGGGWANGVNCGSRSASFSNAPSASTNSFGARGCADHLRLR